MNDQSEQPAFKAGKPVLLWVTALYPESENVERTQTTHALHEFARHWTSNYTVVVVRPRKVGIRGILSARNKEGSIEGVTVLTIPYLRLSRLDLDFVRAGASRIQRALGERGLRPSIVLANFTKSHLLGAELARRLGLPLVCGIHKTDVRDLDEGQVGRYRRAYERAALIACRSPSLRSYFLRHFPEMAGKTTVAVSGIPAGLIRDEGTFLRKYRSIAGDKLEIVTVASLIMLKGIDTNLRALAHLGNVDWHYSIAGEGPERGLLERLSRELGIEDRVSFLGQLRHEEVFRALDEAAVFLLVSYNETFGIAFVEAMARGCLVIGARGWGIDGIVEDGRNGFLCEPNDADGIIDTIKKARGMGYDRLEGIAASARETILGLEDVAIARRYLDDIEAACLDLARSGTSAQG